MKKREKVYHGVKGEQISMVDRQNKGKTYVASPDYGSMTFWKNKDFWQSMMLYAFFIALFSVMIYFGSW